MTLLGSGGPTYRNIGGTVYNPYSDVVAPTTVHEESFEEAGALSKIMDFGPLEGRCRDAVATFACNGYNANRRFFILFYLAFGLCVRPI